MTDTVDTTAADTAAVAQIAADASESAGEPITPTAQETAASDHTLDDTDVPDTADEAADSFPRSVVEKLRKESASMRDRAKTAEERAESAEGRAESAEARLLAVQRQLVGQHVAAAGMKPAAVAAVASLDDVLADDGFTVDADKVAKAIQRARVTLGAQATPRRNPVGRGSFQSGASGSNIEPLPKSFASAFRRSED